MELIVKIKRLLFVLMILGSVFITGCHEGDNEADFGFGYIYIPQATVSGGLNNYYPVPGGSGEYTSLNYKVENGKLNVLLGIIRSGKLSNASGFSVDVGISQAETDEVIAYYISESEDAEALLASIYTLPDKVTVDAGKDKAPFLLSVDINSLLSGTYDGKKLVLSVTISNPTQYELSDVNTSVVVVIDVDSIRDVVYPAQP